MDQTPLIRSFVAELHAKDPTLRHHVIRTAELAVQVGQDLQLGEDRLWYLALGALLHDVGKLHIPDAVLFKAGPITPAEYEHVKRHSATGEAVLLSIPTFERAARFVRQHHERIDGHGYPDGLRGGQITLEARVIAVCDGFDAMAHDRNYRTGMGPERAAAILQQHAGTQWDAAVVELVVPRVAGRPATPRTNGPALDNDDTDRAYA